VRHSILIGIAPRRRGSKRQCAHSALRGHKPPRIRPKSAGSRWPSKPSESGELQGERSLSRSQRLGLPCRRSRVRVPSAPDESAPNRAFFSGRQRGQVVMVATTRRYQTARGRRASSAPGRASIDWRRRRVSGQRCCSRRTARFREEASFIADGHSPRVGQVYLVCCRRTCLLAGTCGRLRWVVGLSSARARAVVSQASASSQSSL
jgi:hypothetical protein